MTNKLNRRTLAALVSLVAVLCFGAATASAHGGPGGRGGLGGASVSSLVTQAAKELGVTRAKLVTAIQDSAATRIDTAVDDGDLSADRAADVKAEVQDNLSAAYSLSETKTVASNLGITTAALNTGFKAARKTVATAKIDAALAAGQITATEAADLKAQLSSSALSGYKGGLGGHGLGFGFGH
jgi:polyhydroxyalkanoate synthesis regulator phasin